MEFTCINNSYQVQQKLSNIAKDCQPVNRAYET